MHMYGCVSFLSMFVRVCTRLRNRRSLQGLPVWVDSGIYRENNQKAKDTVQILSHSAAGFGHLVSAVLVYFF